MQWGRKETVIWPPHGPINTYGALFISVAAAALFMYLHFAFGLTQLQQYYLPYYTRATLSGDFRKADNYQLLFVVNNAETRSRIAREQDVIPGSTSQYDGKPVPLQISPQGVADGYLFVLRQRKVSYSNTALKTYLQGGVYGGESLPGLFQVPLLFGLATLLVLLPFSIAQDIRRRKQMKYGRRLRGPERLTPKEFNQRVRGEGVGIKTDGMKDLLRIPAKAEAQHIQVIGDTGAGKTTIILQLLRQIRGRGDSAIVYDPALEYTSRFYDAARGDIILNPLDKRCPYWGPSEELRRNSEADALALSLFQPPQDKKGEFFVEIPQQIFAHLLRYGPTPKELIAWMSNPAEIDKRVAGTEVANYIDKSAGPQRVGVLASLSKVAKSLRLLPERGEGNGEWSATKWAETRQGWIFITSLPPERTALQPLQSVWIDMLVMRLLNEPRADQKRVWFVLDELASLQRLPQLATALTENRKSKNPIILGFQGKAQLEVIYGHLAEVMLSQPSTSIYLKTKEPKAGEWVSNGIGKVEIERMKETRFDGSRSGRNFSLDRQIEPVVMESEISGLPDLHAFMKHENYVTGFSFPYLDLVPDKLAFDPRFLENDKLSFDPGRLGTSTAAPIRFPKKPQSGQPSPFADPGKALEADDEPAEESATAAVTPTPTPVLSEQPTPEPQTTGSANSAALHIGG
jgi:hypothetical protein